METKSDRDSDFIAADDHDEKVRAQSLEIDHLAAQADDPLAAQREMKHLLSA
jgi:hypothetical protein